MEKHYDHSMLLEEERKEDLRKERKLYERDAVGNLMHTVKDDGQIVEKFSPEPEKEVEEEEDIMNIVSKAKADIKK